VDFLLEDKSYIMHKLGRSGDAAVHPGVSSLQCNIEDYHEYKPCYITNNSVLAKAPPFVQRFCTDL